MAPGTSSIVKHVLYVEDHPVNVKLMQALFEQRPALRLTVATNGAEALALSASLQPSLLMLDLRLPDCHGTELLPLLRERFDWHDVPAVAVTAESGFDADGTGFAEVWHKPVDLHTLLRRLDAWLTPQPDPRPPSGGRNHAAYLSAGGD